MVFEVDQFALEQLPACQQRAHLSMSMFLTWTARYQPKPHHLRDAARVIPVDLVPHCRQRNAHVARFDDDDRKPGWLQFAQ
ncbi:hypothetical protein [Bradyrhizobium sp. LB11.1]|uniref:hypothetical protein n=1 Tax=Bradyrhizobium sp. LB11.1 TaxID=3156326 RepID=UPI0033974430